MMKLYEVSTVASEYHGCRDVKFIRFRERSGEPARPYSELIESYDPERNHYEEGAIEELFTFDEANALKEYLDREHGSQGVTKIEEAKLPCRQNVIGIGAMSVGGGDDFYTLKEEKAYSLPFDVQDSAEHSGAHKQQTDGPDRVLVNHIRAHDEAHDIACSGSREACTDHTGHPVPRGQGDLRIVAGSRQSHIGREAKIPPGPSRRRLRRRRARSSG
jgi:hypothetical protein